MKQIESNNKKYLVLDETDTHYICEPVNCNEGYNWVSKNKAVIVK